MPNLNLSPRFIQTARVRDIKEVVSSHYQLRLESPSIARVARPGQFVHVLTKPNSDSDNWNFDPLLRRAFSIMSVNTDGNERIGETDNSSIDILFRVGGRGTKLLSTAKVGDEIEIIGPLGKPFDLSVFEMDGMTESVFHVKQNAPQAIIVGGGVGVPPLIHLANYLNQNNIKVNALIGARHEGEVIGEEELSGICQRIKVTTDDGSRGHAGRVTDLLVDLISYATQNLEGAIIRPVVYACGPWPMLKSVAQICATNGVRCQVSLEENMPCGIGVCNGCVVRVRQNPPEKLDENISSQFEDVTDQISAYGNFRRVCVEGPACWANEIDWS